jgi:hypothetical protein
MSMQSQMEALSTRYHNRYGQDETMWTKHRKNTFDRKMKAIYDHHENLRKEKRTMDIFVFEHDPSHDEIIEEVLKICQSCCDKENSVEA